MQNKNDITQEHFLIWCIENELWEENSQNDAFFSVDFYSVIIGHSDSSLVTIQKSNIPLNVHEAVISK